MHPNSQLVFEKYAVPYFGGKPDVLEIGPNGFPSTYRALVSVPIGRWDTVDILDDARLTFPKSDPYRFPVPDGEYDVVMAGNVLEHVPKVWVWVRELARVCKPGGVVITVNPLSWTYHAAPFDCWRVYPDGMRALYDEAGLTVLHSSFESIEKAAYRRTIPGVTFDHYLRSLSWPVRAGYRLAVRLGFPAMAAYDTITIGRKDVPAPASEI
jgi:SAM-dependent methyltransferase